MVNMAFGERRLAGDYGAERLDYVEWVNHVIALHKRPEIEEFRVFFDLTKTYKNSIDEWVRFALTKKVQRLELNFNAEASRRGLFNNCYAFDPYKLLKGSFSDSIDHVKYLKKIFLNNVDVSGEALVFFLCNCPLLEHLSVSESKGLSTLKIIGPFASFKRLEIHMCYNLKSVEIRDVNLVYLKYVGSRIDFVVENLPLLVELYIGLGTAQEVGNVLLLFSNYIPQLEILTFDCVWQSDSYIIEYLCSAVKLSNLKQLIVKAWISYGDSLIPLTNLVHASPCLQRFVFEATQDPFIDWAIIKLRHLFIDKEARKRVRRSYPQLKEIQYVGYQGEACELELLTHFLDNAVALEKILVDCKLIKHWGYLETFYHRNKTNERSK